MLHLVTCTFWVSGRGVTVSEPLQSTSQLLNVYNLINICIQAGVVAQARCSRPAPLLDHRRNAFDMICACSQILNKLHRQPNQTCNRMHATSGFSCGLDSSCTLLAPSLVLLWCGRFRGILGLPIPPPLGTFILPHSLHLAHTRHARHHSARTLRKRRALLHRAYHITFGPADGSTANPSCVGLACGLQRWPFSSLLFLLGPFLCSPFLLIVLPFFPFFVSAGASDLDFKSTAKARRPDLRSKTHSGCSAPARETDVCNFGAHTPSKCRSSVPTPRSTAIPSSAAPPHHALH